MLIRKIAQHWKFWYFSHFYDIVMAEWPWKHRSKSKVITPPCKLMIICVQIDGLVQERCNASALELELNRHQTILQTFLNFFLNLTLPGVPHLNKQLPNGQYLSDLCKMCNLDANLWKRWIGDHRIMTYIFKWERLNTAGQSHSVSITTEWPHYITSNWPQVVPQKAYRC